MQLFHRHRTSRTPRRRPLRGVTTVEVSICLPVLLMFFYGSIEFSRVNMLRHAAGEAAYEGARRGISPGATVAGVKTAANDILATAWAKGGTIDVSPATIDVNTTQVTVNVSIPLSQNSLMAIVFFPGSTNITGSCTLKRERYESISMP